MTAPRARSTLAILQRSCARRRSPSARHIVATEPEPPGRRTCLIAVAMVVLAGAFGITAATIVFRQPQAAPVRPTPSATAPASVAANHDPPPVPPPPVDTTTEDPPAPPAAPEGVASKTTPKQATAGQLGLQAGRPRQPPPRQQRARLGRRELGRRLRWLVALGGPDPERPQPALAQRPAQLLGARGQPAVLGRRHRDDPRLGLGQRVERQLRRQRSRGLQVHRERHPWLAVPGHRRRVDREDPVQVRPPVGARAERSSSSASRHPSRAKILAQLPAWAAERGEP